MDTRLKYSAPIKHLKSKTSQLCRMSFRLSKFSNFQALKKMYSSCMYSVLRFCIGVWGGVSQCIYRYTLLNLIHKRTVENLFQFFFFKIVGVFFKKQES